MMVGKLGDSTLLSNYYADAVPIADAQNPIELSAFLRIGQTISLDPVTVNGYVIPARQVQVLGDSTTVTFVYTQTHADSLAKTGVSVELSLIAVAGILLTAAGLGVWSDRLRAQQP